MESICHTDRFLFHKLFKRIFGLTCMFELFFVPKWFYGIDAVLEGIVVIVALLIAGYAYKVYKKLNERKFKFFSLAFLLIGLSFLAKIFTHLVIVSQTIRDLAVGTMQISLTNTNVSDLFYRFGFFYLTSLALMVMITFNYSKNYLKKKTNSTLLVAAAFILLALSQLIFLFDFVDTGFYIGGVIVELIGYLTLLAAFIMVLKK